MGVWKDETHLDRIDATRAKEVVRPFARRSEDDDAKAGSSSRLLSREYEDRFYGNAQGRARAYQRWRRAVSSALNWIEEK